MKKVFIVEGIDGVGKSTLVRAIKAFLPNKIDIFSPFTDFDLFKKLKSLYDMKFNPYVLNSRNREILLATCSMTLLNTLSICINKSNKEYILVDRYFLSTLAYMEDLNLSNDLLQLYNFQLENNHLITPNGLIYIKGNVLDEIVMNIFKRDNPSIDIAEKAYFKTYTLLNNVQKNYEVLLNTNPLNISKSLILTDIWKENLQNSINKVIEFME